MHTRTILARAAAGALLVAGAAGAAHAQAARPDSLPGRPGQWGAEGEISATSGIGAGLLRFVSPRSALTFHVVGSYERSTLEAPDGSGGEDVKQSTSLVTARLGWRRYAAARGNVSLSTTLGAELGYGKLQPDPDIKVRDLDYGAFLDLGGTYFLNRQLGVTAIGGITAGRRTRRLTSDFGGGERTIEQNGFGVALTPVRIAVTLLF